MPPAKSSDPMPMEADRNLALKVLGLNNEALLALTTPALKKARAAACLKNHPDKLGPEEEADFSMDQIEWACGFLQQAAEEGDHTDALEKAKVAQLQCCFGQFFCKSSCEECLELARRSFSCPGCNYGQAHLEQCACPSWSVLPSICGLSRLIRGSRCAPCSCYSSAAKACEFPTCKGVVLVPQPGFVPEAYTQNLSQLLQRFDVKIKSAPVC